MNVLRPLVVAAVALIALAACGGGQTTAPDAGAQPTAIPLPTSRNAYVTSISGSVQVQNTAGLQEADPGRRVEDGRLVIVPDGARSDLQFGHLAFVRLYGPAQAVVRTLAGRTARPVMEIELQSGSVAASVMALSAADVFRIRSRRALYVVRGTRFHVSSDTMDTLTVDDGVVAILPRSLDVPALLESAVAVNDVREALLGLEESAPSVRAGGSVTLGTEALEQSELLAVQLEQAIRSAERASEADRPSLVEQLLVVIRATSAALAGLTLSDGVPAETVSSALAAVAEARLLPAPDDEHADSLLDDPDAALVRFTLRTVPQNARIYIGGVYVGESVYRGVVRANQSLSIRVTKIGYRERRIQVDRARGEVITVQLERLPPSIGVDSFVKAIRADDVGTVRTYVQEGGTVDVWTEDGVPAVVLASGIVPVLSGQVPDLSYHRDIFGMIIAAGANLNANFVVEGATFKLLHAAVLAGVAGFDVPGLVRLLVDGGADVNSIIVLEGEELTPLAIAVRWALFTGEAEEELIRILLEGGASLDVAISYEDQLLTLREIASLLMRQGEIDDPSLIRLLREAGAAG